MINTLNPSATLGHDEKKGEILERIAKEYGKPEEKREANKKLGKDEFFKIMVTQIQHQDPLKPYENEQMAAQMAQFTALEQMMNVNTNLEKLTQSQQPLHHLGAANLIGKQVTSDSSRVLHTEGRYSDLNFELPKDAATVTVSILNAKGEMVREIELKNQAKGKVSVAWDGKRSNGLGVGSGQYMLQINAKDAEEKSIPVQTAKSEIVNGVSFEGNETVLLTGDVTKPNKMLLKHVTKIIDVSSQPSVAMQEAQAPAEERMVEDYKPGESQKYFSVNPESFR